jgi:hypothetical protein
VIIFEVRVMMVRVMFGRAVFWILGGWLIEVRLYRIFGAFIRKNLGIWLFCAGLKNCNGSLESFRFY